MALGAALAALLALPASFAIADRDARVDPRGDAFPRWTDIRKLAHSHGKKGLLRHVILAVGANPATRAAAQLQIRAGGKLYLVNSLGASAFEASPSATASANGVRVRRRGRRIVFVFHRRLIGNPRSYRWAATIGSNDTSPLAFDRAPNRGMLLHRLR